MTSALADPRLIDLSAAIETLRLKIDGAAAEVKVAAAEVKTAAADNRDIAQRFYEFAVKHYDNLVAQLNSLNEKEKMLLAATLSTGAGPSGTGGVPAGAMVDSSRTWAIAMLEVDATTPLPDNSVAIRAFLEGDLPHPLPTLPTLLNKLLADGTTVHVATTYLAACGTAQDLASAVSCALHVWACPGVSEMYVTASSLFPAIDGMLKRLADCSGLLQLEGDRNTTDNSQATIALARPDCCMWHNGALVFKGEDKTENNGSLALAIQELGDKMSAKWHPLTLGSLPYLLCYASCGSSVQFCVVMRDTNTAVPVSNTMNMFKICVLRTIVNVFRLLRLLADRLPSSQHSLPLGRKQLRSNGASITFKARSVLKQVAAFVTQPNVNPDFNDLVKVYGDTADVPCLVHCVALPKLTNGAYSVELAPLGYERCPSNEAELKCALRAVLQAVQGMHRVGFVHRDLRWPNILRDARGDWFVIDLESAAPTGAPPGAFKCKAWTAATLVDATFTDKSDVEMVGNLFSCVAGLSEQGYRLSTRMCHADPTQRPSAAEALDDPWLAS